MDPKQTNAVHPRPSLAGKFHFIAVRRFPAIARALQALSFVVAMLLSISPATVARGADKIFLKIVDVDAVSVTVSVGTDGNSHQRYLITDTTTVLLNGLKANARDLRSGMIARIRASEDGKTALNVTARDAPAHPSAHGHRTG